MKDDHRTTRKQPTLNQVQEGSDRGGYPQSRKTHSSANYGSQNERSHQI